MIVSNYGALKCYRFMDFHNLIMVLHPLRLKSAFAVRARISDMECVGVRRSAFGVHCSFTLLKGIW